MEVNPYWQSSHCHRGSSFKHSLLKDDDDDDDDAYNKSFLKLETQSAEVQFVWQCKSLWSN